MIRVKMLGLVLVAVFAISALAASAASAAGGPDWWVKKSTLLPEKLAAGNSAGIESTGVPVEFKLKTTIKGVTGTIKCKVLKVTAGELIGGVPGTDKNTNEFTECKGEGFAALCEVKSATGVKEVIGPFGVKTTLVFLEEVEEKRLHALDRFLPEAGTTFVSFKLAGGFCPNVGEVHVKGCVLAELWQGGAVAAEKALAKEDELNFPEPPIEKYELWNGTAFEKLTCPLKSQFQAEAEQPATQVGRVKTGFTAAAKTLGFEEAGWIKE
jgi:hypothetical protein